MKLTAPLSVLLLALCAWTGLATAGETQAPLPYEGAADLQVTQASSGTGVSTAGRSVRAAEGTGRSRAARVVFLLGEVVAVDRDGNRRTLGRGSEVSEGETLVTGEKSQAQLRFTDGALLSLRAESRFRIDEYRYERGPEGVQRAFFSLLQGGLRTITGVIGKRSRHDYRVDTPVATIGKRGTHYALYLCQAGGCVSPERLEDGLYGGVVEGAVAATTKKGVKVFATDQYFHVASLDAVPESLFRPPAILFQADAPAIQAKGRRRLPSDGLVAFEGGGSANRELSGTGPGEQQYATDPPVFQAGEVKQAEAAMEGADILGGPSGDAPTVGGPGTGGGTTTTVGAVGGGTPQGPVAMVSFIHERGAGASQQVLPAGGAVSGGANLTVAPVTGLGANGSTVSVDPGVTGFTLADNFTDDPKACDQCDFDWQPAPPSPGATLWDAGASGTAGTDQVNWGRWNDDGYEVVESGAVLTVPGVYFLYSPDIISPPTTGSATFTYAQGGGPSPMDHLGNLGTLDRAEVEVRFGSQQITRFDLDVTTPNRVWNASLDQGAPVGLGTAATGGVVFEGTCTGAGCSTGDITGNASLRFVGNAASPAGDLKAISAFGLYTTDKKDAVSGVMVLGTSNFTN